MRTAIAVHEFVLSNAPQPDQLLFLLQPGEAFLLQCYREDLKGEVFRVLPRRRVKSRVGKDASYIALIERSTRIVRLFTFVLLLHLLLSALDNVNTIVVVIAKT